MTAGGEVWEKVVVAAQRIDESKRIHPRKYPCPLGCGYMFNHGNANRHAASPTACPTRHNRANPPDKPTQFRMTYYNRTEKLLGRNMT